MTDGWLGDETVGELIARARERLGKSQYALAEALRDACARSDGVPDRSMVARFVALYGWRDPKAGLRLTQHTARLTAGVSQVLTGLAMLHTAESHAMLGDRHECEQTLEAADAQFAQIQPGDPAIDLFSPSQPGRLAGSCYLFLHDAKSAAGILDEAAQALQDESKSQAVVLGNLALAHIRLGALDAAVARLNMAIDVTERNRGGGGLTIICSAGRQLRRWRDSAEVQDVYDRIMALMAA
jgi:hypothetical protein